MIDSADGGPMLRLVLSALRARRAQTVALFALTVLAALGGCAAPWFLGWSRDAVATADIASAPAVERVVKAGGPIRYGPGEPSPTTELRQLVGAVLDIPGAQTSTGASLYTDMVKAGAPNATAGLYLGYRDDVCAHLSLRGECPHATGDVVIGGATAERLHLAIGDQVTFTGFRLVGSVTLTVRGTYEVADLTSDYWAGTDLLAGPGGVSVAELPAFTTEQTLLAAGPNGLDVDLHMVLPPSAFHRTAAQQAGGPDLGTTIARASVGLRDQNLGLDTRASDLVERIRSDQRLAGTGIVVAATQLVLLCWFALFLAVRHTADERRPDIGLLKLRGAAPWRIWSLAAQQSALPMLTGAVLGWGLGYLAAAVLAGGLLAPARTVDSDPGLALRLSILAAAVTCVGALVAAVVAEWSTLRAPVAGLLRRVPARTRPVLARLVDLAVVAVAVAGVYQGRAETQASVFALLAPGLVGLAVALLVARLLPLLAARAGRAGIRAGRPDVALVALHLARRPGTHRVFAVLALAAAVLATTTFAWHTATVGWARRAAQELGAPRVLTVRAANSSTLLAAVRAADPDGRYAMAVAETAGVRAESRVLAVDTTRLNAVAPFPQAYGLSSEHLAELLRPPTHEPPRMVDGPITLDAEGPAQPRADLPVSVRLHLSTVDGSVRTVDFGPLGNRGSYQSQVQGCPPPAGCRLTAIEAVLPLREATPAQSTISLYGLRQAGADVVGPAEFADITRWRAPAGSVGIGNVVSARDGRLALTPFTQPLGSGQSADNRVFVVAAPTPIPVVLAGARPDARRPGDERIALLGGDLVNFQVVGTATVLPGLGASGVLVDLESAQRDNGRPVESTTLQVWLAAGAPAAVVDAITARGVVVLTDSRVADAAARFGKQGPGMVLRFDLFAALVVLLVAAGMVVVTSTVERRARLEELTALRAQGLSRRAVLAIGYGTGACLVLGAVVSGVVAALLALGVVTTSLPVFSDGWTLLPVPHGPALLPLIGAVAVMLIVLGGAAVAGAYRLIAGTERPSTVEPLVEQKPLVGVA
jgi:ABC-type antimicrobial peptide transport system permease subunit